MYWIPHAFAAGAEKLFRTDAVSVTRRYKSSFVRLSQGRKGMHMTAPYVRKLPTAENATRSGLRTDMRSQKRGETIWIMPQRVLIMVTAPKNASSAPMASIRTVKNDPVVIAEAKVDR